MSPLLGALLGFALGTAPVSSLSALTAAQWITLAGEGIQLAQADVQIAQRLGVSPLAPQALEATAAPLALRAWIVANGEGAVRLRPGMGTDY